MEQKIGFGSIGRGPGLVSMLLESNNFEISQILVEVESRDESRVLDGVSKYKVTGESDGMWVM